jgi:hypothetical protein
VIDWNSEFQPEIMDLPHDPEDADGGPADTITEGHETDDPTSSMEFESAPCTGNAATEAAAREPVRAPDGISGHATNSESVLGTEVSCSEIPRTIVMGQAPTQDDIHADSEWIQKCIAEEGAHVFQDSEEEEEIDPEVLAAQRL